MGENSREEMVDNVRLDNAVEKVLANEAKVTIHSSNGTLDESPAVGVVVVHFGVVVVEVGNGHCKSKG
jgi:hypothetical protein